MLGRLTAQSADASLTGQLTDPSGGVVAEARVTVTHTSTALARTTETNRNGYYAVPALPAGEYASEVARAAGLHRGTAYNILRTLQAEGFVGYDEATRSYAVSLHILELANGVLRRSGLLDLARPLMHAVSDAHGVSVYLSKVLGPSSLLLLDWVGAAFRTDLYVTVGRQYPGPAGASGVIMGAFGSGNETELEALFSEVAWYRKPSFADFLVRVREARQCGFAVDRGAMFQGITQVSVPVLSPSWELLLVLTAAGHAHDFDGDAVGPLSRAMQSAAARLSESVRLLRLG